MGLVTGVDKKDIFKRKAIVSNPWLDPNFSKVESFGGEPGFKVDDIPERLGLVQKGESLSEGIYYFYDLEGMPDGFGKKGQFLQTDGKSKLSWAWPFWSKSGSTVYYKSGKVAIGHAAARTIFHISKAEDTIASRISCKVSPWRQWECLDSDYGFGLGIAADDKKFHVHYDIPIGTVSVHLMCFDALNSRVGIFDDTPSYPFDVGVNTRIQGSFTVTNIFGYDYSTAHSLWLGYLAAEDLTTGQYNVIVGEEAAKEITEGGGNTIAGYKSAGNLGVQSSSNAFFGTESAYGAAQNASYNVGIGSQTLFSIETASNIVAVGYRAGYGVTTGGGHVLIGDQAGGTWLDTETNKLIITNSNTATPLIYGDFSTPALTFNGSLTLANSYSLNLQEDITFTGATAQNLIKFPDNLPTALDFREGATSYLLFRTSDGTEGVTIGKALTLSSIAAGDADYDKFLVSHTGLIKYRTGAQVLSDIGGQASDAELSAIAGLTSAADRYIRFTGSGTADLRTYANVLADIGAAASSHAMSTHSDEDTYNISTTGKLSVGVASTDSQVVISAGQLFIGDAAASTNRTDAGITTGICINQASANDIMFSLKAQTVDHGITERAETDTYGLFRKVDSGTGGLRIMGFTDANVIGLQFEGIEVSDDTTKNATSTAPLQLQIGKKSGTNITTVGADGNLLVVKNWGGTRFIVDEDGDILYDGGASSYQGHDDIKLLAELENVLSDKISKLEMKKKDIYKKHKVVHVSEGINKNNEPYFSRFVSTKKKNMLLYGAIRQLNERVEALEARL